MTPTTPDAFTARMAAIRARLEAATAPGAKATQRINMHAHAADDLRWLLFELLSAQAREADRIQEAARLRAALDVAVEVIDERAEHAPVCARQMEVGLMPLCTCGIARAMAMADTALTTTRDG
jgi:hypothetical protein